MRRRRSVDYLLRSLLCKGTLHKGKPVVLKGPSRITVNDDAEPINKSLLNQKSKNHMPRMLVRIHPNATLPVTTF